MIPLVDVLPLQLALLLGATQRGDRLKHSGELRQELENGVGFPPGDLVQPVPLSSIIDLFVREADVDVRGTRLWRGWRRRKRPLT